MKPASILTLVVVATLIAAAISVQAQTNQGPTAGKDAALVNIEMKDTTVKEAIDTLFKGSGKSYFILPGVTGNVVDLKLKGVTFEEALKALADAAELQYTLDEGVYTIGPAKQVAITTPSQIEGKGPAAGTTLEQPAAPAEQPMAAAEPKAPAEQPAPAAPPATQVVINQAPSPVYYGQPAPVPYGYDYPPVYRFGNVSVIGSGYSSPVVVAGGNPYVFSYGPRFPPPPGWVSPEVMRFLRGQWAIRQGPYFISPYPY